MSISRVLARIGGVKPGLIQYSLRHGFAWIGSRYYDRPVPLRDLASLMGHDPKTHHKHYDSFTRDEDKKDSVRRAVGDYCRQSGPNSDARSSSRDFK